MRLKLKGDRFIFVTFIAKNKSVTFFADSRLTAGILGHDFTHFAQDRAGININTKISEFEAYQRQSRIDRLSGFRGLTDQEILDTKINNPGVYDHYNPFGKGNGKVYEPGLGIGRNPVFGKGILTTL